MSLMQFFNFELVEQIPIDKTNNNMANHLQRILHNLQHMVNNKLAHMLNNKLAHILNNKLVHMVNNLIKNNLLPMINNNIHNNTHNNILKIRPNHVINSTRKFRLVKVFSHLLLKWSDTLVKNIILPKLIRTSSYFFFCTFQ